MIRPTGLLDPVVEVRPAVSQVDDLLDEIENTVDKGERVLVTTLTKRMAEELTSYLINLGIRSKYIHSDVDTLERVEIMRDLRMGVFDVLVGVNLLREGLDLPEVSLVAILDADKEGFLRSDRALIQTIGRAARNVHSKAILYGDTITGSMQRAIDLTNRHREKQIRYNMEHGIVPKQIVKSTDAILGTTGIIEHAAEVRNATDKDPVAIYKEDTMPQAAEPRAPYGESTATQPPSHSFTSPRTSSARRYATGSARCSLPPRNLTSLPPPNTATKSMPCSKPSTALVATSSRILINSINYISPL